MSDLNIALILKFIDQATAPARAAMQNIQGAAERVERFGAAQMAQGAALRESAAAQTQALQSQTLATIATGWAFYATMRPAIEFEAQMDSVAAKARASAEDQLALEAQALALGASTRYSALEVAGGMENLVVAGLNANQTIAALPGVLDLAAASGEGLASTADYATNILSGFQLGVDQMNRVGDVLVNTFTSSNTGLSDLALGMSYAAPIAAGLNVDLETTAAMLGRLGDAGIKGEKGGTAVRAILSRLAAPSTEARRALDDLGVSISDADGNMRPIVEVMAELNAAMEGMGDATQGELRSLIFGMEAAGAARILLEQAGSGALDEYTESLRESGSAARVAADMSDNAKGSIARLRSAVEGAQIALGNGLLPMLVDLTERLAPIVATAGEWIVANQELVTTVSWIAAGLLALNIGVLAAQWGFWLFLGQLGKLWVAGGAVIRFLALAVLWGARLSRLLPVLATLMSRGLIAAASLAGTFAGWLIVQVLRLVGALIWLSRGLLTLASRAALAAVAGLRALGAGMVWVGRALAIAGRALLTNPIFLAIAAVAAAVYVIYDNWDGIVAYFTGKFDAVKAAFEDGFLAGLIALWQEFNIFTLMRDAAEGLFTYLTGWTFEQVGAALVGFIGFNPFTELRDRAEALFTYLTGWNFDQVSAALRAAFDIDLYAAGVALIESLIDGIWSLLTGLGGRIAAEIRNGVASVFGGGDGDGAPTMPSGGSGTSRRAGRDSGGVVRPGFIYEINERNQEFFQPSVPGSVIRGSDLARGGARGGQSIQIGDINVYAPPGMDPREIAREVERQLRRALSQSAALHDGGLT